MEYKDVIQNLCIYDVVQIMRTYAQTWIKKISHHLGLLVTVIIASMVGINWL